MVQVAASELNTQYWEPFATGPLAQVDLTGSAQIGAAPPTTGTIANAGTYNSNVIGADGFKNIGIGCKSSNTGVITIQRYLDKTGLVPVGVPITANLVANTAQWATVNDTLPFQSFTFSISNTGAGAATITNFACLLSAG